jgi:hypothetical protein
VESSDVVEEDHQEEEAVGSLDVDVDFLDVMEDAGSLVVEEDVESLDVQDLAL